MNCRERCRLAQHCTLPGYENVESDECPTFWRLEDMEADAFYAKEPLPFDESWMDKEMEETIDD